jgi:hypothetical protein
LHEPELTQGAGRRRSRDFASADPGEYGADESNVITRKVMATFVIQHPESDGEVSRTLLRCFVPGKWLRSGKQLHFWDKMTAAPAGGAKHAE